MNEFYASGGFLKALDRHTVGGFAVVFGGKDRQGEYFSKESFLDIEDRQSLPVYWHHRLDPSMGERLGRAQFQLRGDAGLWTEFRLPADSSGEQLYELAQKGSLGWSSGSSAHLIERVPVADKMWLKSWPLAEISICPADTTVEPRARVTVTALKSYYDSVIAQPPRNHDAERKAAEIYAECLMRGIEMTTKPIVKPLTPEQRAFNARLENALAEFEMLTGRR